VKLVDEASLLACATDVDLNPIRAAIAETLETSAHTSAERRIEAMMAKRESVDEQSVAPEEEVSDKQTKAPIEPLRCSDVFLLR